jgi:hypothetical protein
MLLNLMKLHALFVFAAIFCLSVVRNSEIRVFFFFLNWLLDLTM